ncbi:sulfotransferase family protein [Rubrobacter indicoceani]|uniref:sulfotransferase family protein n=1 Tax=Rubrobacter indicoceani TaxID=2051957 RepID=UPI000E5ACB0B|nr:sulfotransferase [Rubrobacter indicoceani]
MEQLRDYRARSRRFDRLVGVWMSNEAVAGAVRSSVLGADGLTRKLRSKMSGSGYSSVFFVAGEMRSGTSWLRRTISAHPEISCGGEGSFFGRDYDHEGIPVYSGPVSSLTRPFALSEDSFRAWHGMPWNAWAGDADEDLKNIVRRSVDYFLEKEVERTGKRIIGDKSPQHTENLDEIHAYYPDAKVIHIIRDGRDVAVSAMNHWWRLAQDSGQPDFHLTDKELKKRDAYRADREAFIASGSSIFAGDRLAQLARRWNYRVEKARRDGPSHFGENYLELRYEDLLARSEETVERTLDFLGAASGDELVKRCIRASSFENASSRRQGEEDSSSFFRKGIAGDWKNVFTERDREVYEEIAGGLLREAGYGVGREVGERA